MKSFFSEFKMAQANIVVCDDMFVLAQILFVFDITKKLPDKSLSTRYNLQFFIFRTLLLTLSNYQIKRR
jgi:hypothetical protein